MPTCLHQGQRPRPPCVHQTCRAQHSDCPHMVRLDGVLCSCGATCGCQGLAPSACPRMRFLSATAGRWCSSPPCSRGPPRRRPLSALPSARASCCWRLTWHATSCPGQEVLRLQCPHPQQQNTRRQHSQICHPRNSAAWRGLQWVLSQSLMWRLTWQQHPQRSLQLPLPLAGSQRRRSCTCQHSCSLSLPRLQALPGLQQRYLRRHLRQRRCRA